MSEEFHSRVRQLSMESLPLPGAGQTARRHRRLAEIGQEDLSVAKIAEAHWDAVAILNEAKTNVKQSYLYGVWASEMPGHALTLSESPEGFRLSGTKHFCSGTGLLDCALVTVTVPEHRLVAVDLQANRRRIAVHPDTWHVDAFRETRTGSVTFEGVPVTPEDVIGGPRWYLERPGFWNGALGPAACWAGGAAGLLEYALHSKRNDAHTLAHIGAMDSNIWAINALLETAGHHLDHVHTSSGDGQRQALRIRHVIEQACTDVLQRFARVYGPHPLTMDRDIARRYAELDIALRQVHGERDLEVLGRSVYDLPA